MWRCSGDRELINPSRKEQRRIRASIGSISALRSIFLSYYPVCLSRTSLHAFLLSRFRVLSPLLKPSADEQKLPGGKQRPEKILHPLLAVLALRQDLQG